MKQKSEFSVIGRALATVASFDRVYRTLELPLCWHSDRAVKLPSLKKDAKLPDVLNQSELRKFFVAPALLKHRILLLLIYSAGLRSSEVINLKIADIDFERTAARFTLFFQRRFMDHA